MVFPTEDSDILYEAAKGLSSVLEFGPGLSTHAFIKAGCSKIVTCEHHSHWYDEAVKKFKDCPQVQVIKYDNLPEVVIVGIPPRTRFDLAFVDNPVGARNKNRVYHKGQENCARWNTLEFAMKHSDVVFLHDCKRPDEQNSLQRATNMGWHLEEYKTRRGLAKLSWLYR